MGHMSKWSWKDFQRFYFTVKVFVPALSEAFSPFLNNIGHFIGNIRKRRQFSEPVVPSKGHAKDPAAVKSLNRTYRALKTCWTHVDLPWRPVELQKGQISCVLTNYKTNVYINVCRYARHNSTTAVHSWDTVNDTVPETDPQITDNQSPLDTL